MFADILSESDTSSKSKSKFKEALPCHDITTLFQMVCGKRVLSNTLSKMFGHECRGYQT